DKHHERDDVGHPPPPVRHVPPEVGAQREEPRRERDQPHRLPEQRPRPVRARISLIRHGPLHGLILPYPLPLRVGAWASSEFFSSAGPASSPPRVPARRSSPGSSCTFSTGGGARPGRCPAGCENCGRMCGQPRPFGMLLKILTSIRSWTSWRSPPSTCVR